MNRPIQDEEETTNGDLLDLAAGQMTFAGGVRLRFALLLDRKRAAEYAQLRQLRRDMRSFGTISDIPPAPLWPAAPPVRPLSTPTVTWGKFTMKRRNVLAAYAVMLLTMTGIAVARQWAGSGPYAQFVDAGRTWKLSGPFGGKAVVRNADGKIIGQYSHPDNNQVNAPLIVAIAGVTKTIWGAGRHEITDKFGKPLGSVEISPMTYEEIADMNMTSEKKQQELTARYAPRPEFPLGGKAGKWGETESVTAMPGLINSCDRGRGLSWKLIGYAKVTERYPAPPMTGNSGESLVVHWEEDERKYGKKPFTEALRKFAPARNAEPVLHWMRAQKSPYEKDYPIENGWWKIVRQTGTFRGYGKHEIRDESGSLFVTLTVTPLKAK